MSSEGQLGGTKPVIPSNIYTVYLAAAFCILLATAAFVTYKCFIDYQTIFKIP